jgi:hypothetical protein
MVIVIGVFLFGNCWLPLFPAVSYVKTASEWMWPVARSLHTFDLLRAVFKVRSLAAFS